MSEGNRSPVPSENFLGRLKSKIFKKPIPTNVQEALKREEENVFNYKGIINQVRKDNLTPEQRQEQIVTAADAKVDTQRLVEQIRTEFDLPPKYEEARKNLSQPRDNDK